jgi:isopentenyl-diphosphate delta-isomerase
MKEPCVILVDKNDRQKGIAGKMEAHHKGLLHRAVSVFIINPR